MKDTFSSAELTALRNDLTHDFLIDSREAAELPQLFLTGRGFGASPEAARDTRKVMNTNQPGVLVLVAACR